MLTMCLIPENFLIKNLIINSFYQAGLPFEFTNICDAMKFLEQNENTNLKTQVIGVAFACVADIYPTQGRFLKILLTLKCHIYDKRSNFTVNASTIFKEIVS
jgi:hypothetical protein